MIHSIKVGSTTESLTVNMLNQASTDFSTHVDFQVARANSDYYATADGATKPYYEGYLHSIFAAQDNYGEMSLNVINVGSGGGDNSYGVRIGDFNQMSEKSGVLIMGNNGGSVSSMLLTSNKLRVYESGSSTDSYYSDLLYDTAYSVGNNAPLWEMNFDTNLAIKGNYGQLSIGCESAKLAFSNVLDSLTVIANEFKMMDLSVENGGTAYIHRKYDGNLSFRVQGGSAGIDLYTPSVNAGKSGIRISAERIQMVGPSSYETGITINDAGTMYFDSTVGGFNFLGITSASTFSDVHNRLTVIRSNVIDITRLANNTFTANGSLYIAGASSTTSIPSMCIIGQGYGYLPTTATGFSDTKFVVTVGGSAQSRKNGLRLTTTKLYLYNSVITSGAGLTELFEWVDGNPDDEDRVGHFVTLIGEKIRYAEPSDDYVLGAVDPLPLLMGDTGDTWHGMYKKDVFGRVITERVFVPAEVDEKGNLLWDDHYEDVPIISEEFNPDVPYIERSDRKEYTTISSKGKVVLIDDGTCVVGKFATVGPGGIATYSDDNVAVRVMKRIDDTHIKVFIDASFLIKH